MFAVSTYTTSAATASGAATSTSAATGRAATASALCALTTLGGWLWLAGQLYGDLAVEDGLAVELVNGALGLGWGRDIDEGVANGASGTGVGWDGGSFTGRIVSAQSLDECHDALAAKNAFNACDKGGTC